MNISSELLTVVVPIYNVERFLGECLDSLKNQSCSRFKVVMVNDGSKDSSGAIARKYAEEDPERFLLVEQENKGLGAARNTGMKYVKTPYVAFLDSDDWYPYRAVELITKKIAEAECRPDIIFTTPTVYNMASNQFEKWMDADLLSRLFRGRKTICPRQDLEAYALEANACRCIYRTGFFERLNFTFPEGVKWEDIYPHFYLYHEADVCMNVDGAGFMYRTNSGNQITASTDRGRLDILKNFSDTLLYALEDDWSRQEIAYIISMMIGFSTWSLAYSKEEVRKELTKGLHELYRAIDKDYFLAYEEIAKPGRKRKLFWRIMRLPLIYKVFGDYHTVDKIQNIIIRK